MDLLKKIKKPVEVQIGAFEKEFKASMKSPVPLINIITNYILKRKGKQIRPLFVFLSAGLNGKIRPSTNIAASLIELLHTATLVHDDVVDDSDQRRGIFSVNALWKNKAAVLVGDYLLSKGLLLALNHDEFDLLKIVSNATREMSEGELLQIEKARKLDIEESVYFDIIRKKTASLIASCCAAGAASSGANKEHIDKMWLFGEYAGIAFQIKDDLFYYEKINKTGKPSGIDIKEKKMTLPLIHLLRNTDSLNKQKIIRTVKKHGKNQQRIDHLIEQIKQSGGLEYAREKMQEYHQKAVGLLEEFPDSPYKTSLLELLTFTIEREK